MENNVSVKTAIVTGAAKGIGKAIALKLADEGFNIVLNYRSSEDKAIETEKEIKEKNVDVLRVQGDITNPDDVLNLINKAKETFGKVDVMVNNAGITKDNLILRMKEEEFDSVINTNLKGVFNCLKAITPIMVKQKCGKIINISSVVGVAGNAGQVNYAASKAGVIGMTKSLAKEIGSRGITVNAVAPGFIQTDMTSVLSDKLIETVKNEIPLKKLGTPEDVANVVSFLASEKADYVTGQVIHVDGGMVI